MCFHQLVALVVEVWEQSQEPAPDQADRYLLPGDSSTTGDPDVAALARLARIRMSLTQPGLILPLLEDRSNNIWTVWAWKSLMKSSQQHDVGGE